MMEHDKLFFFHPRFQHCDYERDLNLQLNIALKLYELVITVLFDTLLHLKEFYLR
jgi:hypothetical protein